VCGVLGDCFLGRSAPIRLPFVHCLLRARACTEMADSGLRGGIRPAAGSVVLAAFVLASCVVSDPAARPCPLSSVARADAEDLSAARLHPAFAVMPLETVSRLPAAMPRGTTCQVRSRFKLHSPSRRTILRPLFHGVAGLRASSEGGDLKDEFEKMLGTSGRDRGMKEIKAPKGSIEWLKQQNAKGSSRPTAAPAANPAEAGSLDAAPALASKPAGASLAGPAKPRFQAPDPTYSDLDALLSGKTPAAPATPEVVPEMVAPAARPSYAVSADSSREDSMVALASFDKGDAVPESVWAALTDDSGQSLSLSTLASQGGELVLLVPEVGHHTGAPAETWTKLLIDLQNMLGSQPDKVKAVAVSPESNEVHAKMVKNYNFKLFNFASDSERTFLAAHKIWDPLAAKRGVTVERQMFIIDTATKKFAHVFHSVPAVGHAEAVRDVLTTLQKQKADAEAKAEPVLSLAPPPPKPAPAPETAAPAAFSPKDATPVQEAPKAVALEPLEATAPVARTKADIVATQGGGDTQGLKSLDEEEGFLLAVESVGPLIGRGGARVKELAAKSGASIRFESLPSPTMFARGSPEQRGKAYRIVMDWINNSGMERVALPLELHGRVIGSGGSKIKEIEFKTRAHVLFEKEPEPCMVVRGSVSERAAAIAMANEIIASFDVEEEKFQLTGVVDRVHVRAVLGYKGTFIKELEEKAGIKVRYNLKGQDDEKFLVLIGSIEARQVAKELIEQHLVMIKDVQTHELDDDEVRSLMGYKGTVVHRLEEGSGAIISMESSEEGTGKVMTIRGTAEQRGKAWELAQDVLLNDAVETHDIPIQMRRVVVGPNGTVVKRVEKETGAGVTLLNDGSNSSRLLLRGKKEERAAAWKMIENIVYSEVGVERIVVDKRTTTELLRNRARRCKDLELATGTYISIEKEEGTQTPKPNEEGMYVVMVRGLSEQRAIVKSALEEMVSVGPERVLLKDLASADSDISIFDVRRIIGPRGSRVSEMEEATGASIRLEVEPEPYVSVMGLREQKDAALDLIRKSLTQEDLEFMPLDEEMHGVVIGVSGRSVQMIEKESGAQISFRQGSNAAMVVRGNPQERALAIRLAEEVLSSDTAESFIVGENQASALIGARGRTIREIETATGARVQVMTRQFPKSGQLTSKLGVPDFEVQMSDLRDDQALVIIKGKDDQRKKARDMVMVCLEPEGADEELKLTPEETEVLMGLNEAVRRDIQERSGARLVMNENADGVVVYGKISQRTGTRMSSLF
jgi:peroxiredoxin/rRNA processing protein Krr1/Pno1